MTIPSGRDFLRSPGIVPILGSADEAVRNAAAAIPTGIERMAELFNGYPPALPIMEAVHFDTIPLFELGLEHSDAYYARSARSGRLADIMQFGAMADSMYNRGIIGKASFDGTERTLKVKHALTAGFDDIDAVEDVLPRLQLLYAEESLPVQDEARVIATLTADGHFTHDLETAYGAEVVASATVLGDLASLVRGMQGVEPTRELLDARFAAFVGLLQMGLSTGILRQLTALAAVSNNRARQALVLANRYRDGLLADNLLSKQQILDELATMAREAGSRGQGDSRRILDGIATQATSFVVGSNAFLQFFGNVYRAYKVQASDLPPLLRNKDEELPAPVASQTAVSLGTLAVPPAASATQIEATPADPPVLHQVKEDILGRSQELLARMITKLGGWALSPSARKREGFAGLPDRLIEGSRFYGNSLMEPLSIEPQGPGEA